ncbi:nucleotidyltransferase family protein [Streptococcus jiangjianxini]|uniref:nucleotidyltransferase family protein n=1 Tax=Streptococcus jiangjianxini TaxID=3161189 RepID=UPI0032EB7A43
MIENDFLELLKADQKMMHILKIIEDLQLEDSWLAAGAVRNYIWNLYSGLPGFDSETDLDVVFYDPDISYDQTMIIQETLKQSYPSYLWELKNQVYMHTHNPETSPYKSTRDAIRKYPETATAVALRKVGNTLEFFAPYGLAAIYQFEIHPTPHYKASTKRMKVYQERVTKKNWQQRWPRIRVFND